MENQETPIQTDQAQAEENTERGTINEQSIEVLGGGHIVLPDGRGIPGMYANCRLIYDAETLQPLRVEPLSRPPDELKAEDRATVQEPQESEGQEL